ncbi:MAG: hypothetical protein AUJ18_01345 [Candidatus Hydrogenedentes bacterium CG1_02_42_14]|nr:MAG: hypothetical protein AUJ18_01345 [Candidatus Hydrogenedentes bacterium CG1_02_42_14]
MFNKKLYFVGIGGSGMMPLALLYASAGFEVSGSDRSFDKDPSDERLSLLKQNGISVFREGQGGSVGACAVVSTAIESSHPDIAGALSIEHRSLALKNLLKELRSSETIMVAGSSGKTTTTAMIGWILERCGYDPLIYLGGELNGIAPLGARFGRGIAVLEIDESDGSIEKFSPDIGVLTSISEDHKPLNEIELLFSNFMSKSKKRIVSKNAEYLLRKNGLNCETADEFAIPVSGLLGGFNRVNEALAVRTAMCAGITEACAKNALKDFPGVARRLQILFRDSQRAVIDDFAHNPEKVAASLLALRKLEMRLMVIFQPHGYGPTKMHAKGFGKVFSEMLLDKDRLVMLPIFDAGGTADRSVKSEMIIENVKGPDCISVKDKDEAYSKGIEFLNAGGALVVMGARDHGLKKLALKFARKIKLEV